MRQRSVSSVAPPPLERSASLSISDSEYNTRYEEAMREIAEYKQKYETAMESQTSSQKQYDDHIKETSENVESWKNKFERIQADMDNLRAKYDQTSAELMDIKGRYDALLENKSKSSPAVVAPKAVIREPKKEDKKVDKKEDKKSDKKEESKEQKKSDKKEEDRKSVTEQKNRYEQALKDLDSIKIKYGVKSSVTPVLPTPQPPSPASGPIVQRSRNSNPPPPLKGVLPPPTPESRIKSRINAYESESQYYKDKYEQTLKERAFIETYKSQLEAKMRYLQQNEEEILYQLYNWMTLAIRLDCLSRGSAQQFDKEELYTRFISDKIHYSTWPKYILTEMEPN